MDPDSFDLKKILRSISRWTANNWQYIVLIAIMFLGLYLRTYHIDYPTIGYHNMKEDEFLSFAINMHDSGDYIRTTWFDCSVSTNDYFGDPYERCHFNESETPLPIWLMILFFTIFGWKLWVARMSIILFSVGTIALIYLVVKKVTDKEYLALLSAFFYAVLPLSIFFGRNIQMDSPSLFLGLCTLYFFISWLMERKLSTFIVACIFFVLTAWFKITSLIVLSPLLFMIPYKEISKGFFDKKYWKEFLILAIAIILSVVWLMFIAGALMPTTTANTMSSGSFIGKNNWIDLSLSIFTSSYWNNYGPLLKAYASDNYSIRGLWMILLGFALFLMNYKSKISKFMFGYALGIILFIIIFAYKWNAHNYYQFPFLPFAAICLANVIFQAGAMLKSITKIKYLQLLPILLIVFLIGPFKGSTMQQFNTQFFGQDVAGEYINQHTQKGEIFLLERHIQGQMSWTAQRFYYSIPDDVEKLKEIETKKGLKYIVLDGYGIQSAQSRGSWDYIQKNYHIAQAGFIQNNQGPQIYHLILERGGEMNFSSLNNKPAKIAKTYEMSTAEIPYYVVE